MPNIVQRILIEERRKRIGISQIKASLNKQVPSLKAIETGYNGFLQRFQLELNKEIRKQIEPITAEVVRQDAIGDLIGSIFNNLKSFAKTALEGAMLATGITKTSTKTSAVNYKKYDKGAYKQLGINAVPANLTADVVNNWVKTNTDLITNVNTKQLGQLETLFRDSAFSGTRSKQLEQSVSKIFKGTRNNVALIARDQVGKLSGQLDKKKQTEAGIDSYYWRTSRDERVRSTHTHREGVLFSWDQPPADGHPGQPIRCRCDAEPAIDKLLLNRKEYQESYRERRSENERKRAEAIAKFEIGPLRK